MSSPLDHLVPAVIAVIAVAVTTLPLLLLTSGVLVVALISTCSTNPARQQHSRKILDHLTTFGARVLRRRGPDQPAAATAQDREG